MGISIPSFRQLGRCAAVAGLVLGLAAPGVAQAQMRSKPSTASLPLGEQYKVEVSGAWWTPTPLGVIASSQPTVLGSDVSFTTDLGYTKTRFRDFGVTMRPAKKHKLKFEFTPIEYSSSATLQRTLVFNGVSFPVSVPIESSFSWKVWRFGYEYDFLYRSRFYAGVVAEVRGTEVTANVSSVIGSGTTAARAPLPALGLVGRVYPLRDLAVDVGFTTFSVPNSLLKTVHGNYRDWNVSTTVDFGKNFGVKVGWRRLTTTLTMDNYSGNLDFQGMWWGAVLRY